MESSGVASAPALTDEMKADVCIIGAGIAGLTTAYLLTLEGKSVVVLDDGPIGGGETERTTAHLATALDTRYFLLERLHGARGACLAAQSHTAAIRCIEAIVASEKIDCDFERVDGYLFVPPGQSAGFLDFELAAAHRAGLSKVQRLARAPLDSFETGACLRFPQQAQFHPLKYLSGLARVIDQNGGRIFARAHVTKVKGGSPACVETKTACLVMADAVVVATNTPVNDRLAIHTKQAPYRSYVIGARVPPGAVPRALYWDTAEPSHYVRVQSILRVQSSPAGKSNEQPHDLLIVGGEDHKTGQADDAEARWDRLEQWARQRFPQIATVQYRWSGQVMQSIDGLAFIGRNPMDEPNVFIATGDSGSGMTHGTIAGMLLTDLICGQESPWAGLYDPARITFRAAKAFARENLNAAAQYRHWVSPGQASSAADLAPGTGAVFRQGVKKVAAYCDDRGVVHELSPACPHLGCIVAWNQAEKSWDCPCHGSRFEPLGGVLNGPAVRNLAPLEEWVAPIREPKRKAKKQPQEHHV